VDIADALTVHVIVHGRGIAEMRGSEIGIKVTEIPALHDLVEIMVMGFQDVPVPVLVKLS